MTFPVEDVPCNACGGTDYKVRYDTSTRTAGWEARDYTPTCDSYGPYGRIVVCRRCKLVFTNPRPTAEFLYQSYASMEDSDYQGEDDARCMNAHLSLHTIKQFARGGALLDIGSAAGYLLNAARLQFDVQGLEPNRSAARFAREKLNVPVVEDSWDGWVPDRRFSVITMVDVIEHVRDPKQTVAKAHAALEPGGLLYCVTPNIASVTARLMGRWWWGLRPAHLYYFNPTTLRRLFEACGFEILLCRTFGRIFTLSYWTHRLEGYSSRLIAWPVRLWRKTGLDKKLIYINTFDSIEVCARKIVK